MSGGNFYDPSGSRLSGSTPDSLNEIIRRLGEAIVVLQNLNTSSTSGLATEVTLQSVLAAFGSLGTEGTLLNILSAIQQGKEFEQSLITDENGDAFLQIRIYNTETHTFDAPIYVAADGSIGTPVPPLSFINPNTYLGNINATLITLNNFLTALSLSAGNIDANTLRVVIAQEQEDILTALLNVSQGIADLLVNLDKDSGNATANTLRVVLENISRTNLQDIATSIANIDNKFPPKGSTVSSGSVPVVIAPDQSAVPVSVGSSSNVTTTLTTVSTSGSVTGGFKTVSFANTGATNVTVASNTITPGMSITIPAIFNSTNTSTIAYDATGGSLLIILTV